MYRMCGENAYILDGMLISTSLQSLLSLSPLTHHHNIHVRSIIGNLISDRMGMVGEQEELILYEEKIHEPK